MVCKKLPQPLFHSLPLGGTGWVFFGRSGVGFSPSLGGGWGEAFPFPLAPYSNNFLLSCLTGYHTAIHPMAMTVKKMSMISQKCTLTG